MISHQYKCILIHPPRVGGTSIEKAICGSNWWSVDSATKHILASQAKAFYADYWDKYFKFSIVRNPWDRCVSFLKYSNVYYGSRGRKLTPQKLEWYKQTFGFPITIEMDYRFYTRADVIQEKHRPHAVYGNFLDEDLDFVGRFETLTDDFKEIANILGLPPASLPKAAASSRERDYRQYFTDDLAETVWELYRDDCRLYGYEFNGRSE